MKILENMLKLDLRQLELFNPHNFIPKGARSGGPKCA
jgi:hypothetical protein